MDKFDRKEMEKKRHIKSAWYDSLINYIPNPIREAVGGFFVKKVLSLFKTNTPKDYGDKTCKRDERNQVNQKHKINLKKT